MELRRGLLMLHAGFLLRRANRQRRRQLEAELASYASQADLDDLWAVLSSYPEAETREIRQVLCQHQMRRVWTAGGAR